MIEKKNNIEMKKRLERNINIMKQNYSTLYPDSDMYFNDLIKIIKQSFDKRNPYLLENDLIKSAEQQWYMSEKLIGMSLYVDLFAINLNGIKDKISYFKYLGVNVIYLLPFFKTNEGKNDGGFAISSYREINPELGTIKEFEELVKLFYKENIIVCVDFVLNHTSKYHDWALKARSGDKSSQDMYIMFDTYKEVEEYEQNMPIIFPDESQTNFIYCKEINKWVCSIFYDYQWDLNYKNPVVFNKVVEEMLYITNTGVNILRMDAIPHIWKEIGTDCFNLPEVHIILDIIKLVLDIVAPSVILLGETIGSTEEIMTYFKKAPGGCELMYNFPLNVSLWNSLASQDTRELKRTLTSQKQDNKCLINYVKSHDDLAWHLEIETLSNLGINPYLHVKYLIDFFNGSFPDSYARGDSKKFDNFDEPATTSGTTASLCGLEKALFENNLKDIDRAGDRILLIYSCTFAIEGLPMLYSGDEIGLLNDYSYKFDLKKQSDSRWLHRPQMNWIKEKNKNKKETFEYKIFQNIRKMIDIRKSNASFHSNIHSEVLNIMNHSILGVKRGGNLIVLCNFSDVYQTFSINEFSKMNSEIVLTNCFDDIKYNICGKVTLNPYQYVWLIGENII